MRLKAPFAALAALFTLALLLCFTAPARADALSGEEVDQLFHAHNVSRRQDLRRGMRRYVGGVAYSIVDWRPDDVTALLYDLRLWKRFIPMARNVARVANAGDDPRVEVSHGTAFINVKYSMRVKREGRVVRFWMDATRPHDIEDVWGFFRLEELADGRTLITFGILIDLGDGMLRDLFEDRVRELAVVEIPNNVRTVIEERTARGRRAAR
jgi:hypothetical protein